MSGLRGNRYLYLLVFVVGTGSLGVEIAAARLMAPFFGASTIIWANTIGVTLVALSIGYWLGGRWSERWPDLRTLCKVILVAAAMLEGLVLVATGRFQPLAVSWVVGILVGVVTLVVTPLDPAMRTAVGIAVASASALACVTGVLLTGAKDARTAANASARGTPRGL